MGPPPLRGANIDCVDVPTAHAGEGETDGARAIECGLVEDGDTEAGGKEAGDG